MRRLGIAALAALLACAAQAVPYYPTPVNDLRDAKVHRNVYVDSAGRCSTKHRCDFRTVGDALRFVAFSLPLNLDLEGW